MPKLPCVSGYKAARAIERLGFERRRLRDSHLVMRRAAAVSVLPMHREVSVEGGEGKSQGLTPVIAANDSWPL